MDTDSKHNDAPKCDTQSEEQCFKKPVLIGKIGKFPKKIAKTNNSDPSCSTSSSSQTQEPIICDNNEDTPTSPQQQPVASDKNVLSPYKEPLWSGTPLLSNTKPFSFEVLKNGAIIDNISLMDKPYWIFGRMTTCHICMQHPTISRFHAVLQYRLEPSETEETGFYIYDLGSTHGTFLNRQQIKPKVYVRIRVGHMIRLGASQRSYILNGPDEDAEKESEFTVTELKEKRAEAIRKREEEEIQLMLKLEKEKEERKRKEEERGVDWGMGMDSDEEGEPEDLSENPFAQTNNEELYIDDPKKALRGFFEREGLELEYECNEHGMGQFLCKVQLPLDDEAGRPIIAEALHKGKKREAVVQCALEACRVLDRYGVLRQAMHESRKRKSKNWEENDFYDSDEDTFLDRTGTVERKRQNRMNMKAPVKAETYESLLEKEKHISTTILDLEKQLQAAEANQNTSIASNSDADSLDVFMKELNQIKPDKQKIINIKLDLAKLRKEHASVVKLVNIAKPANLPSLVIPQSSSGSSTPGTSKDLKPSTSILPMIGKRKKISVNISSTSKTIDNQAEDTQEDCDIDEEMDDATDTTAPKTEETNAVDDEQASSGSDNNDSNMDNMRDEYRPIKSFHDTLTFKKFEHALRKGLPAFAGRHQDKLEKILNTLKKLATNEDRMHVDWKMLSAKKRKVMKMISDLRSCEPNDRLELKVSLELNRMLLELNEMTDEKYKVIGKVKKMGQEIRNISAEIDKDFQQFKSELAKVEETARSATAVPSDNDNNELDSDDTDEKRKKKNLRRIQQRIEKAESEKQKGYAEDANKDDYNMWVPPTDQTGDGKTSLNDKFGY